MRLILESLLLSLTRAARASSLTHNCTVALPLAPSTPSSTVTATISALVTMARAPFSVRLSLLVSGLRGPEVHTSTRSPAFSAEAAVRSMLTVARRRPGEVSVPTDSLLMKLPAGMRWVAILPFICAASARVKYLSLAESMFASTRASLSSVIFSPRRISLLAV